nr:hypothetical protein [Tanacetum cinerariifolium]
MELCSKLFKRVLNLEITKTAQAKEILRLKKRFKRLENKNKSRTLALKRLYKVGLRASVESFDEESLGKEDASKQRRKITDIDADKGLTLIDETTEDQGRINNEEMFDTDVLNNEEIFAKTKALIEIKVTAAGIRHKRKKKDQISFDEKEARRLQAEIDEQDRLAEEKAQIISSLGDDYWDIKTKDFIDAVKDYYCCWLSWKSRSGNFLPLKPDLSGLQEFGNEPIVSETIVKKPVVETSEAKASVEKPKVISNNCGPPIIEDLISDSKDEDESKPKIEKKIIKPSFAKIKFVKSKDQVKSPKKKSVKQGHQHRQRTHKPRGNQRN